MMRHLRLLTLLVCLWAGVALAVAPVIDNVKVGTDITANNTTANSVAYTAPSATASALVVFVFTNSSTVRTVTSVHCNSNADTLSLLQTVTYNTIAHLEMWATTGTPSTGTGSGTCNTVISGNASNDYTASVAVVTGGSTSIPCRGSGATPNSAVGNNSMTITDTTGLVGDQELNFVSYSGQASGTLGVTGSNTLVGSLNPQHGSGWGFGKMTGGNPVTATWGGPNPSGAIYWAMMSCSLQPPGVGGSASYSTFFMPTFP